MNVKVWCGLRISASIFLALIAAGSARAATPRCDRACLEKMTDQYLQAVIKHDPTAAPLFVAFRETENALLVLPGKEGLWQSMTGLGKIQRKYIDTVTQSAGYFGTIMEGDDTDIATLRLKIENGKITEAEWVIARKDTGGPQGPGLGSTIPEGLDITPPPDAIVPKEKRAPRDVLIAVTNSYFDSLQSGNNALMIAQPGWVRLENGVGTGQGRGGAARGGPAGPGGGPGGRGRGAVGGGGPGGGGRGGFGMTGVVARRYPIVDEEKQVVLGMVIFIRPPGSTARRNLLTEWFLLDDSKIRGIWAAMHYLPPTQAAPNWPPYDGNWPIGDIPVAPANAPAAGTGPAPGAAPPAGAPPPGH